MLGRLMVDGCAELLCPVATGEACEGDGDGETMPARAKGEGTPVTPGQVGRPYRLTDYSRGLVRQ